MLQYCGGFAYIDMDQPQVYSPNLRCLVQDRNSGWGWHLWKIKMCLKPFLTNNVTHRCEEVILTDFRVFFQRSVCLFYCTIDSACLRTNVRPGISFIYYLVCWILAGMQYPQSLMGRVFELWHAESFFVFSQYKLLVSMQEPVP